MSDLERYTTECGGDVSTAKYFELHDKILRLFTIVERLADRNNIEATCPGIHQDIVSLGDRLRKPTQKGLF